MSLLLASNSGGSVSKQYVDDLFVSYLRTGNGTSQSVTTGFQPDLIWTKSRSAATGHRLVDSARGAGNSLESNSTLAQQSEATGITALNSSGYSIGADSDYNTDAATYVDWTWKKAPKFFDVVTYTGNGVAGRQIPHSLGVAPGMITTKSTSTTGDWNTYHRSATGDLKLNLTNAQTASRAIVTAANDSTFTISGVANTSGVTYVAYLWAHDPNEDGIIQCGSYTGNGSASGPTVTLGWEPQFLLVRAASTTGNWQLFDTMRGLPVSGVDAALAANASVTEDSNTDIINVGASGFSITTTSVALNGNGSTYIYLAIRRPNKPPTSGTEVFAPAIMTGNGTANRTALCGFVPDTFMSSRMSSTTSHGVANRLTGNGGLWTSSTYAENMYDGGSSFQFSGWDIQDGVKLANGIGAGFDTNSNSLSYSQYFFRRAPGFFSSFAYTGTGANRTTPHDLAAIPDLLIVKSRSATGDWQVWYNGLASNEKLVLNSNAGKATDATAWNNTLPTATNISLGTASATNANGATYIAHAFSNLQGIQKIGTYVGDGTSGRVIDCGFTTGARFVCIKAISTTGSWLVSDTARGITSSNDPYLQLNSTAVEVTTEDWLDPVASGFIVNNVSSSNANVSGVTYMYWAIA